MVVLIANLLIFWTTFVERAVDFIIVLNHVDSCLVSSMLLFILISCLRYTFVQVSRFVFIRNLNGKQTC